MPRFIRNLKEGNNFQECADAEFRHRIAMGEPTYELTLDGDALQKVYIDVDYKLASADYDEAEDRQWFEEKCEELVQLTLKQELPAFELQMATATSHGKTASGDRKFSVRFFVSNLMATKKSMEVLVNKINKNATEDTSEGKFANVLTNGGDTMFDTSVYGLKRKMRCLNTSKDDETRPLVLKSGTLEQTIITGFFDKEATVLELSVPVAPAVVSPSPSPRSATPVASENKHYELLVNGVAKTNLPRKDWVAITGWCVCHITKPQYLAFLDAEWREEGAKMWDDLAKTPRQIPVQFLEKYVRENNYTYYVDWCAKHKKYLSLYVLEKGSNDVAREMKAVLENDLVYSSKQWYNFHRESGLWRITENPDAFIVSAIQKAIDLSKSCLLYKKSLETDPEEVKKYEKKEEQYRKHYREVSGSSYVSQIKKFFKEYLRDDVFVGKLDKLVGKIAFKNGIVDLRTNTFSEGISQVHYLTKTCAFDYIKPNPTNAEKVRETLFKIANCNEEHLKYYLSALGYALTGESESEQAFWYLVGQTASNGKSLLFEVLEKVIPEYVGKGTKELLDKGYDLKKEVATWGGLRILWVNELSTAKKDEDIVKVIGDGTSIKYNKMYCNAEVMKVGFKMFVVSNNSFECKCDGGVKRRLRICQLNSHFKEDVEDNFTTREFKMDKTLGARLSTEWKMELLDLLFDYAKKYYEKKKMEAYPADWQTEKDETCDMNNEFEGWFNDTFELATDGEVCKRVMEGKLQMSDKFRHMSVLKVKDNILRMKVPVVYNSQERGQTKVVDPMTKEEKTKKETVKGVFKGIRVKMVVENDDECEE